MTQQLHTPARSSRERPPRARWTRPRWPFAVTPAALLAGVGVLVVFAAVTVTSLRGAAVPDVSVAPVVPVAPDVPSTVVPPQPAPEPAPTPAPAPAPTPPAPSPAPTPTPPERIDRESVERALVSIERLLADERVTSRVDDVRNLGALLVDADELRVLVDLARDRFTTATAELPDAVDRFEEWLAERTTPTD